MRFNISSLKFRIAFIVFFLEVILLFFVLGQTLDYFKKSSLAQFNERKDIVFQSVSNAAIDALFADEFDGLQRDIQLMAKNSEIESILVANPDNLVLAHSDFTQVGSRYHNHRQSSDFVLIKHIKSLGVVEIVFDRKLHDEKISEATYLGIKIAVIGVIIIFILSLLFGYLLTRRLGNLNQALVAFGAGNTDINLTEKGFFKDEVHALEHSFQDMANQINATVKALKNERELLEHHVDERTAELQTAKEKLEILATIDRLTQLHNRAFGEDALLHENQRYSRTGTEYSVILLDIDHFKKINDHYGHVTGDRVLQQLATILKDHTRKTDTTSRWGGEEFLIICPDTKITGATRLAETIRSNVESSDFGFSNPVTCSFGVTQSRTGEKTNQLLVRVDKALYQAKHKGRNCVVSE